MKRTPIKTVGGTSAPKTKSKFGGFTCWRKAPSPMVCEKQPIPPTQFYQWQKTVFENGTDSFVLTYGDILVKAETYQQMLARFA